MTWPRRIVAALAAVALVAVAAVLLAQPDPSRDEYPETHAAGRQYELQRVEGHSQKALLRVLVGGSFDRGWIARGMAESCRDANVSDAECAEMLKEARP